MEVLLAVLNKFGIPMKRERLIKMCSSDSCCTVRVGKHFSHTFLLNIFRKKEFIFNLHLEHTTGGGGGG
jgi:hypothetical protein